MTKPLTTEEFIQRARKVHGDKYDYSKTEYEGAHTKVTIICPIHGEFQITPHNLLKGCGCRICGYNKNKSKVCGVGINDLFGESRDENGESSDAYNHWLSMLNRCYNRKQYETYKGCTVCEEWHLFSNFKEWFDKYHKEGWQLDKDILVKGNKVYSPETCCFVPSAINGLFTKRKKKRGDYPIGVCVDKRSRRFSSFVCEGIGQKYIGSFNTSKEAFNAYKIAKEKWIKIVADKWKDQLDPKVYDALYNYQVEITD